MSSRHKPQQQSKREVGNPGTFNIEHDIDPNYTPDYYMGTSGYIQNSGQLPDNSGIIDIK